MCFIVCIVGAHTIAAVVVSARGAGGLDGTVGQLVCAVWRLTEGLALLAAGDVALRRGGAVAVRQAAVVVEGLTACRDILGEAVEAARSRAGSC